MELQINGQSAMLGEVPTTIAYTQEWPFGRYTHPAGGQFVREYGRSSPLPEALMEIERAGQPAITVEPVVVPESAAVPAYTAIGGKAYPYWELPEMLESARAERGPSPPYERAYLAGLGRSKFSLPSEEPSGEPSLPYQPSFLERYKTYIVAAGVVGIVGMAIVARR